MKLQHFLGPIQFAVFAARAEPSATIMCGQLMLGCYALSKVVDTPDFSSPRFDPKVAGQDRGHRSDSALQDILEKCVRELGAISRVDVAA